MKAARVFMLATLVFAVLIRLIPACSDPVSSPEGELPGDRGGATTESDASRDASSDARDANTRDARPSDAGDSGV